MAKKKIGAYITLDGEKEFKSAVTSCNKSLATLKSEMRLVEAETAGQANSLTTLTKKHEILNKTLEEHQKKEKATAEGLEHAQKDYERISKAVDQFKEALAEETKQLEQMKRSSNTTTEELKEQEQTVAELGSSLKKQEEIQQKANDRVNEWQKKLNYATAQTIKATKELNENDAYLKEAQKSYGNCAKSIDAFGNKTKSATDKLVSLGNIIKAKAYSTALDTAKDLLENSFESAVSGAMELQDAQAQLQASTGLTTEATKEYAEEMQALYKGGYGDNLNEIADAMATVKQYTKETDPEKIRELAENAMVLESVFGMDLSESIRGADALMNSMGLTAEEAFDYIAAGAQNGLNKSGELVDNLAEYAPLWQQAGFSAEEMFTVLQNGLDSGAYNLDKVNDFVKEFGNSLSDGRIEENLTAFSEETRTLFEAYQQGGATTKEVFMSVISDLENMENQQQALTIASNTWSSLGEDNAMSVITALNDVNETYGMVHGTMEKVKSIKYDTVANQYKALGRTFQTSVAGPIAEEFLPVAQKGLEFCEKHTKEIGTAIKIITPAATALFATKKIEMFATTVGKVEKAVKKMTTGLAAGVAARKAETVADMESTAAKGANAAASTAQTTATMAQATATEEATVAQSGLNAVMAANPAMMVVAGISALVGVVTLFKSCVDEATEGTNELQEAAEQVQEDVAEAVEGLQESTANIKSTLEEVDGSGQYAAGLIEELKELQEASDGTAQSQERMQSIVTQLNTMYPEMGVQIDEVTGKVNMSAEAMDSYVDSMIKMKRAEVIAEQLEGAIEDMVKAEMARDEAAEAVKKTQTELDFIEIKRAEAISRAEHQQKSQNEAVKAYNKAMAEGADNVQELYAATQNQTEATMEYNGEIMTTTEALVQMKEDEEKLRKTQKENKTSLEEVEAEIDSANELIEKYTDEINTNTDATRQNSEAKDEATEQAKASIEVTGQELEAYNSLSEAQKKQAVEVTNCVLAMEESVQSSLESQMNMFEEFDGGVELSTTKLLSNMQSQLDGVREWEENLAILADRGINQDLLQKLADMGPQGAGYAKTFVEMGSEELAQANDLWVQSMDAQAMTDQWGQELIQSTGELAAGGQEAWNLLASNLGMNMETTGQYMVQGLVEGMQNAQKSAEVAGQTLGVKTIEATNDALGIASPSKEMRESGAYVGEGLVLGIEDKQQEVEMAASTLGITVVNTMEDTLRKDLFVEVGKNISQGLADGIAEKRSVAINAAADAAADAFAAAKKELEINSPSRKFRRLGRGTMEGLELGIQDKKETARQTVIDAVSFEGINGKISTQDFNTGSDYNMMQRAFENALEKMNFSVILKDRECLRALSDMGVAVKC